MIENAPSSSNNTDFVDESIETGFVEVHSETATDSFPFQSERVKRLYDWWTSFSPRAPRKDDFDILDHISDADGMFLYKVHSRDAYEIRLNGETAILIMQKHYTGQTITKEMTHDDPHLASLIVYLQKVYDGERPRACHGKFKDLVGRIRYFQSIDCPLMDEDGKVIEIVGILDALD